jgi:HD-GYP domain-containing protein (c-di-GMP phosphodiesterase class II)
MESHVAFTSRLLAQLEFPVNLRSVPGWASSHHEHLNGRGYPNHLSGGEIPIEVRLLTILDIYDALTASDRPYRKAMPKDKAFAILDSMVSEGQIDGTALAWFKESNVWKEDGYEDMD